MHTAKSIAKYNYSLIFVILLIQLQEQITQFTLFFVTSTPAMLSIFQIGKVNAS